MDHGVVFVLYRAIIYSLECKNCCNSRIRYSNDVNSNTKLFVTLLVYQKIMLLILLSKLIRSLKENPGQHSVKLA